ncbi:MAG: guanylate kinase [Pseudomonadota bacterium]
MSTGLLIVVSAPSGAGKTSLVRAALERNPALKVSVSHTTRPMRPGETDGINYHFVDRPAFEALIKADGFVEHAEVFGHCYGTSRAALAAALEAGTDVLLEIDWQGAEQVRGTFGPQQISLFIMPPSISALESRLRSRGQDDDRIIEQRMQKARSEMSHYGAYDYLIVNDDFDIAVTDLEAIIHAERLRLARQQRRHGDLLAQLLG